MSEPKLTATEAQILHESISSDTKNVNIRLRKGEYQYDLAKGIASFQLELNFPDVKDLTRELYGEEKADDEQFTRKIQTILKKMEKSNIVKILPKKQPWELQRYALSGFRFEDVDKTRVRLATPQQVKQAKVMLGSAPNPQETLTDRLSYTNPKIWLLAFVVVISYATILWSLLQPIINAVIFVPAFYTAVACSILLGRLLSRT